MKFYIVETSTLKTIAKDTWENWEETAAFLRAEGIDFRMKSFSDYSGPTITSDAVHYFHHFPEQCPVKAPAWA